MSNQPIFRAMIDGWDSWGKVFQSLEAFAPLIRAIYHRHSLPAGEIKHLTPGTNAVFRVGQTVIKILAPAESGLEPSLIELEGLRHAGQSGSPGPEVLAFGEFRDRYIFPYMVMEFVDGRETGDVLHSLNEGSRRDFALRLREMLSRLNIPSHRELPDNIVENVVENHRWAGLPDSLRQTAIEKAYNLSHQDFVFVHGDLTGENVLLAPDGAIRIIDFGDCHLAPASYEWPPLVFELLRCDPVMMGAFFGDYTSPAFVEDLANAILLHDFGADILKQRCLSSPDAASHITDFEALTTAVADRLKRARTGDFSASC